LISAEQSSLLNQAFQTLRKPNLRASYLLALKGEEITESENELLSQNDLLELLDLMEDASEEENSENIKKLIEKNEKMIKESEIEIENSFDKKNEKILKKNIAKLNYYTRIQNILSEK